MIEQKETKEPIFYWVWSPPYFSPYIELSCCPFERLIFVISRAGGPGLSGTQYGLPNKRKGVTDRPLACVAHLCLSQAAGSRDSSYGFLWICCLAVEV